MKLNILTFATAVVLLTFSGHQCQAQSIPCGADSFYLYGNYQNQQVLLHFIGINGSAYNGNAQEYLYTVLNSTNATIGAIVAQVVLVNGAPQDGPNTFLAPNSTEFQSVLKEALIWGYMDYWYFQLNQQSEMNLEQTDFQTVYQDEWEQELGIYLANYVNLLDVIGQITDDLTTSLDDPDAAEQINSLVSLFPDIVSGYSTLQSSTAPSILGVLENYNLVTSQNYTSAQLIVGMANLDPSKLSQFESDLYTAAFPGATLKPSAQPYLTTFFQNFGTGVALRAASSTITATDAFDAAYGTYELTASTSAQIAVSQAGTFLAKGLPALAAASAADTIIQDYIMPEADILQDMVSLQNTLATNLFPELTTVSAQMTDNNGLANLDNGIGLSADIDVISSFESLWCNLGPKRKESRLSKRNCPNTLRLDQHLPAGQQTFTAY